MLTVVFRFFLSLALACGFWLSLTAAVTIPENWQTDFTNAVGMARLSAKQNLLLFTGLDWERESQRLKAEILSKREFIDILAADFVLTHVDLSESPLPEAELSESDARGYNLARDLKLHFLPSIFLCTAEGRPYGLVGYIDHSPEGLLQEIQTKRDAYILAMARIAKLQGKERAHEIDTWLLSLPESLRPLHPDKAQAIIDADPDDLTGLRSKYLIAERVPRARQLRYAGVLDEAETLYREVLGECTMSGEEKQDLYYELADVYFQRRDYDQLVTTVEKAISAAPQGARMPVLNEMLEVFTRRWIYSQYDPEGMRAVDFDTTRLKMGADAPERILELIVVDKATSVDPARPRNQILHKMEVELRNRGRAHGSE